MNRIDFEAKLKKALTATGLPNPKFAVVLPLVYDEKDPELLIEVRAEGISQAGDPCFPGGKIDPGESPDQAASRELKEELGIHVPPERFLGQLPTVRTRLGSNSDVFVCTISKEEAARVQTNPAEVSVLLHVPLSFFLSSPNAYSYPVDGHIIWGMTAGAIRHFCRALHRAGLAP